MNTESMGTGMSGGPSGPGAKIPIYELAKELGIPNKDLVTKIQELGIEAKNHMSRLEPEDASRVKRAVEKERQAKTVQERVNDTVIRRRAKDGSMLHPAAARPAAPPEPPPKPAAPAHTVVDNRGAGAVPAGAVVESRGAGAAPTGAVTDNRGAGAALATARRRPDAPPPSESRGGVTASASEHRAAPAGVTAADVSRAPSPLARPAAASAPQAVAPEPVKPTSAKPQPESRGASPAVEREGHAVAATAAHAGQAGTAPVDRQGQASAAPVERQSHAGAEPAGHKDAEPAPSDDRGAAAALASAAVKAPEHQAAPERALAQETSAPVVAAAEPPAPAEKVERPAPVEPAATAVTAAPAEATAPPRPRQPGVQSQSTKASRQPPPQSKPAPGGPSAAPGAAATRPPRPTQPQGASPGQPGQAARPSQAPQPPQAGGPRVGDVIRPTNVPRPAAPAAAATTAQAQAEKERVFVTAQTRRNLEGLGPTGRVIDLAALRPASAQQQQPQQPTQPPQGRGPRQEVTGERLRPAPRPQAMPPKMSGPPQKMRMAPGKKAKSTQITTAAEHKRVVKMGESIAIKDLAAGMGLKATDVLKKVWELGMRSVMINSPIDFDTASLVAGEFEWRVDSTVFQEAKVVDEKTDAAEDLRPRAPVITIMGHVDHGKTSLLDAIRNANVAAGEAGGITQHIGAYKIHSASGDVVFLDTPGHEAFTEMRARGAQATDIVVLVVAADDGVMPQTLEALNHAKDAKVPIIVAVNKIDKPQAQPDRIRQQLAGHGLNPEEWGGETIYVDVSARTRHNIDKLLENLAVQAEVLELKANPAKAAKGIVIEARMDAKRGAVSTVLVQEGTLHVGDTIVVGEEMGKVRAMSDDKGAQLAHAGPSTPVEVLGLSGVPRAGETLNAVTDERAAKDLVEHRRQKRIEKDRAKAGPVSLDRLMDAMKAGLKELKIILKADVQGSVEALSSSLVKQSTEKVKVTIIQAGVGGITETDVNLAKAGNAVIIGFHVRPAGKASALAEQEGVDIKLYDIIYEALDDVRKAMAGLLAPVKREKLLGKAEVRAIFNIPKLGTIAGCGVSEGMIRRSAQVRLVRDSVQIYQGRLASLRRFKDDVREVQQGYECGMSIEGYNDLKEGDVIEAFEIEEIAATLS